MPPDVTDPSSLRAGIRIREEEGYERIDEATFRTAITQSVLEAPVQHVPGEHETDNAQAGQGD